MVNIRATLDAALEAGIIDRALAARLTDIAKDMFFKGRSWDLIMRRGAESGPPPLVVDDFTAWLKDGQVDQKRTDALACSPRSAPTSPPASPRSPSRIASTTPATTKPRCGVLGSSAFSMGQSRSVPARDIKHRVYSLPPPYCDTWSKHFSLFFTAGKSPLPCSRTGWSFAVQPKSFFLELRRTDHSNNSTKSSSGE